jgi:hypothetical protein
MDEILDEITRLSKGGLLSHEESIIAARILLRDFTSLNSMFENSELVKIYIDVKARINFDPEGNTDWDIKLAKGITDKIEMLLK